MPKKKLTQERLKELLRYNPETGDWIWMISKTGIKKFSHAGCIKQRGYKDIQIDGIQYRSGRLAWFYMEGYWPEYQIDHINRIRHDDRWCNLRHTSNQCNQRNRGIMKNNTSGVTGVCWDKDRNKWRPQITTSEKTIRLGYFKKLKNAVFARWNAEKEYNYPNCCTTSSSYEYLKKRSLI